MITTFFQCATSTKKHHTPIFNGLGHDFFGVCFVFNVNSLRVSWRRGGRFRRLCLSCDFYLCFVAFWHVTLGSICTCPRCALCRACKHVICKAWCNNLIPKEISLSLDKLTRNKKRGRHRKLGGRFTFDDWIVF